MRRVQQISCIRSQIIRSQGPSLLVGRPSDLLSLPFGHALLWRHVILFSFRIVRIIIVGRSFNNSRDEVFIIWYFCDEQEEEEELGILVVGCQVYIFIRIILCIFSSECLRKIRVYAELHLRLHTYNPQVQQIYKSL